MTEPAIEPVIGFTNWPDTVICVVFIAAVAAVAIAWIRRHD